MGDYGRLRVVPARPGGDFRAMTPGEVTGLRQEVMNGIEYAKLIKVAYGDGGNRKMLLFSAVDCGFCQRFEQEFAKYGNKVNTTFYVVPSAFAVGLTGGVATGAATGPTAGAEENQAQRRLEKPVQLIGRSRRRALTRRRIPRPGLSSPCRRRRY